MQIKEFLIKNNISYDENVSLARKSWIKFGGVASLWISPKSVRELEEVCRYLYGNNIAYDIVGQTSNIFFHSTYNPQVVVSTVKANGYKVEGSTLTCDCGCNVMKLAKEMLAEGYAGFYGLVGLPGTVASSVYNNAGCFDCSISSMLISAKVLMPDGTQKILKKDEFNYSHRSSAFKRKEIEGVILSVNLKIEKARDFEEEYRKSKEAIEYRKTKQEGMQRNLGSIFSTRKRKRNIRNNVAYLFLKILMFMKISNAKYIYKRILLLFYGYNDLDRYISNKNLNTFIWQDGDAENKFGRYKEFMNKLHEELVLEIEER